MIEPSTWVRITSTQGYDLSSPVLCKVIYTSVTCDSCLHSVTHNGFFCQPSGLEGSASGLGASGCPGIGPFSSHPGGSLPI